MKVAAINAIDAGRHPLQTHAKLRPLKPPKTLSLAAQAIWKEVVASQPDGTYAASDARQLEIYCDAVVEYHAAQALLSEPDGYTEAGSKGQAVPSIWVGVRDRARQTIDKVGTTLFLTPASRQTIRSLEAPKAQVSEFGSLIQ